MTGRRLIIQASDAAMEKYLNLARLPHSNYATRIGADYAQYTTRVDPSLHPAWDRVKLILDAFGEGYDSVLWLDADTLVLPHAPDIFHDRSFRHYPATPIHMCWAGLPWTSPSPLTSIREWVGTEYEGKEYSYNNGVLLLHNSAPAIEMLTYMWDHRHADPLPHHHLSMWEGNWMLDWALRNRQWISYLDTRWNCMPFTEHPPQEEAYILGFHGMPHEERWASYASAVNRWYGATS